jgi:hypothetical protein
MNKWFLRLFVALLTFLLSVALTGALRFVFGRGSATYIRAVEAPRPFLDFSDDQAQIAAIYNEYGEAQTRHDRAFFERVEADNFMLFTGRERLTREQDIQWMQSQPADMSYDVRVHHIRVFGNSAVARGDMLVTFGNGETTEWPFIDVWVKRYGTWQIQSTTSSE